MSLLPVYRKSFFASQERSDGLGLSLRYREGAVYADMTIDTAYEGYDDVVHGGMLFGVLDVIMWYAIFLATKKICMTRKTEMEFFKPVECGATYRAQGSLMRVEEKDVWACAWIKDGSAKRYAQATALFKETKHLDYEKFLNNFNFDGVSPEIMKLFAPSL